MIPRDGEQEDEEEEEGEEETNEQRGKDNDDQAKDLKEQGREKGNVEEESELDLRNDLRDDILETVDECLTAWEKGRIPAGIAAADPLHRCIVCTLPHGACVHTQEWLENRHESHILDSLPKDNVDLAMDDISDVLAPAPSVLRGIKPDSSSSCAQPLSNLRWERLSAQPADELSGEKIDLSSPLPRAGHTMVLLNGVVNSREDARILVVFGGVSITNSTPSRCAPSSTGKSDRDDHHAANEGAIPQQVVSYHADVRVFRLGLSTWHCPTATGDLPGGRYGHVSLALDNETIWMFGGRLQGGRQAGDTYVLNTRSMSWRKTNSPEPSPTPRVWSAAVKVRERIILFGGADIHNGRIFNDVWTWNVLTQTWGEEIVVGTPPLARYGHALLPCPDGQVLILGGCCVSTSAEEGLPVDHDRLDLQVRVAADMVNRAYQLEEAEVAVGAFENFEKLGGLLPQRSRHSGGGVSTWCSESSVRCPVQQRWKDLSRGQAQLAAAIAARERNTLSREEKLREVLYEQAAMNHWAKLQSRHPLKKMDTMFLDVDSMIWGPANQPPVYGGKTMSPSARMHFGAIVLGQKVLLWGGCLPTSKRVDIVNEGVQVFDLVHRRWSSLVGGCHPEGVRQRVDAAIGQLRRAERALFEATQRAMTLGAPGGRTMQVVQAEAVLAVNQWRVQRLEDEFRCAIPSPRPRAAHAGCAVGHRVMFWGGWGADDDKGGLLVLDVEQPSEKERRLEEEFHLRLERERQQREAAEADTLRRVAMEEKMRKGLELAREASENAEMVAEDARSAIPELTIAPTPRLHCANSTTLWIEWDRPTIDAIGNPPDERIAYTLYMCGGFREWVVGDHVLVEYMTRAQRRVAASRSGSTYSTADSRSLALGSSSMNVGRIRSLGAVSAGDANDNFPGGGSCENSQQTPSDFVEEEERSAAPEQIERTEGSGLPAVITDTGAGGGQFDIRWDDGERERGVRRHRIHRAASPSPPWTKVYEGEHCRYAVEGIVPESVIQRERDFPFEVSVQLSLQTKGTEVPREKLSRHSPVVTARTNFQGQGPLGQGSWQGKRGISASVKARLATAKALDDSISAAEGLPHSSASRKHPMHGQYKAMGRGHSYL